MSRSLVESGEEVVEVKPGARERILRDLEKLEPGEQERAAELVHDLVAPSPAPVQGCDLLRFAGTLDDASAREIQQAIEDACERADPGAW